MPDARCLKNSFYTLCFVFVLYFVFLFSFLILSSKKIFPVSDATSCAEKKVLHFKKKKKLKGQGKKQKTVKESRERLKAVLFLACFDVRELID